MDKRRSPEEHNQEGPVIWIVQALVPFHNPFLDEQPDWHLEDARVPCYACGGYDGKTAPPRLAVKEFTTQGFDPTAGYKLICGHSAID